jgi:hypothetical protein
LNLCNRNVVDDPLCSSQQSSSLEHQVGVIIDLLFSGIHYFIRPHSIPSADTHSSPHSNTNKKLIMSSRSRKKNAAPPLPPWQRLHKPVVPAPSVVDAAEQKKGAASAVKGDAKGTKADAVPTNHPSNEPKEMKTKSDDTSTKNAPSTTTDEGETGSAMGDMKMPPPAVATASAGAKNNKKSTTSTPSSKKSSHRNSNDSDSDDDDSDDEPTFKNFTAVKCPRTSLSAEAYAKRLREKEAAAEEEQQQKIGKSSGGGGGGGVASSPRRGKRDRDKAAAAQQDVMATATIVATTAKKPRLDSKKKAAVPKESAATSATRSLTRGKALPEDYLNALDNGMMESEEIPSSPQRSSRKRTQVVPYTITDAPDSSAAHGETASASTPTKKSPKKRKATKPADKKKKPKKVAKKAAVKGDDEDDDEVYVPGKDGEDDDEAYVPPTPKKKHHVTIKMEQTWKERIVMLKEHKAKYGTTDLCVADKESVNQLLRSFVFEQRKQHKKYLSGKHSSLNAERVKELEDLGFEFDPMASGTHKANAMKRFQQQWDEMYDELVQYKNVNGNCLVPLGKNADAKQKKLGNWVRGQRKLMNKEGREKFDPQRLAKLEAIDFDWNPLASGAYTANKRIELFPKVNAKWMSWYNKLVKFKEEHGNLIVGPKSKNYPGLYNWVHGQRKEYKRYQNKEENVNMYEEWIKLMHDIGFDFAPMSGEKTGFSDMLKKRSSGYFDQKWEAQYK